MFGRTIAPLGSPPPPRPFPKDRTGVGARGGEYGLLTRKAGSDWPSRAMQFEQRRLEMTIKGSEGSQESVRTAIHRHKWEMAADQRDLVGTVRRKVSAAMRCYDDNLTERRERIRIMLLNEECSLERELVERAQRVRDDRMEELRQLADSLKVKREAERKVIVDEKRLQQYIERCEDLRPVLAKRNLIESKNVQLMQMKDNECKKEEERLRDKMWYEINMKDIEAKKAREERDVQERYSKDREDMNTLKLQLGALEEQRRQKEQLQEEERKDQERVREELRQEEIQRLKDKIAKRDAMAEELREQIAIREAFLAQRKKEEDAIDNTFAKLAAAALKADLDSIQDNTERLRRESNMYCENLAELKKERAMEEVQLQKLLDEVQKEVNERRDANRKIIRDARQKLLDETMEGRRQQVEDQRQKALEDANMKAMEKELTDRLRDTSMKLFESNERNQKRLREQYRVDLLSQIEYNTELKRREQEELDREFLAGLLEEERYKRLIKDLIAKPLLNSPHPFYTAMVGESPVKDGGKDRCNQACLCSPSSLV